MNYPIFFLILMLVCEFLPTFMFVQNLKHIWSNGIVLSKNMVVEEKKNISFKSFFISKKAHIAQNEADIMINSKGSGVESSKKTDSLIGDYD